MKFNKPPKKKATNRPKKKSNKPPKKKKQPTPKKKSNKSYSWVNVPQKKIEFGVQCAIAGKSINGIIKDDF